MHIFICCRISLDKSFLESVLVVLVRDNRMVLSGLGHVLGNINIEQESKGSLNCIWLSWHYMTSVRNKTKIHKHIMFITLEVYSTYILYYLEYYINIINIDIKISILSWIENVGKGNCSQRHTLNQFMRWLHRVCRHLRGPMRTKPWGKRKSVCKRKKILIFSFKW